MLRGTEKATMLADPSLTNKDLIQHCFWGKGDFHRSTWIRKSFFSEVMQ